MPDINRKPYITLLIAPSIPESARVSLEARWREVEADALDTLVVNYDCYIQNITIEDGEKVLVCAPEIPTSELSLLREKIQAARTAPSQENRLVVVNYECVVTVIPQ